MSVTDKVPGPGGESPPPKAYGERTVGLMIQRVLAQAGLRRGSKKTTSYYVALVEDRLRTSARRTWLILGIVAVLIAAGIGLSLFLVWRKPSAPIYQNTAFNYGEPVGTGIAASQRFNVFLLAGERGAGLEGFCTAFAVSSSLLATNAHCVVQAQSKYRGIVALMNGVVGRSYRVTRALSHPQYVEGQLSPDVGLLEVAGPLPSACTLAQGSHLGSLAVGSTVFVYGFPSRLSTLGAPEATFTRGEVGRLTTLSLVPGDSSTNVLIQHSAFISGGTSGSPMFDAQGRVVGINAGGFAQSGTTLSGYNYGIRIDVVMPLFASFGIR